MSELELLNREDKVDNNSIPGFNSVGQILCYYRNLRGISLNEIANNTKISIKCLSQLEQDMYDSMPSPVFVYSYIKHFAKEVGLDGNELVKLYQSQFGICESLTTSNELNSSKIISEDADLDIMYLQEKDVVNLSNNNGNSEQNNSLDFDKLYNDMAARTNNNSVNADHYQENNNMQVENMYDNSLEQDSDPVVTQEIVEATNQAERILLNARREAERMLREAKQESNQLRIEAKEYADSILRHLESELTQALMQVKNGKDFIKSQKK